MRFWMRPRSTVRYALWLGGLLVLLGGLFGMHGLDNHGGTGMATTVHAAIAGPADPADPAEHRSAVGHDAIAHLADEAVSASAAVTGTSGSAGIGMGVAGMCVAVLVVALIALLLPLLAGRLRSMLCLMDPPARTPEERGREPDPPSLIRLSIQRC